MKIAINCWVLRNKNFDGIGYFTINTIRNIIKDHPEVEFQILCDKNFNETFFDFPNAKKYYIYPPYRHPILYVPYIQIVTTLFLRKHRPDLFVSMDGFLSLITSIPQLPVIYDINFEHKPEGLKFWNRIYFLFFFKRFARKAKRIATISEYSKEDIARAYKLDCGLIDNVSAGINGNFAPLSSSEINATRAKWTEGMPYFFFVGSMHPRKNIKRLIQAFSLFKKEDNTGMKLVIAGSILWSGSEIEVALKESAAKTDILFTGRLSDADLALVLGSSYALTFVPVFEGFGLPVVEAMQSGVPVICSNITSLPEVAGNAALMVDPYKIEDIAKQMSLLSKNDELRADLIAKAMIQKEKFSWTRTSQLFWNSIIRATTESSVASK